MQNKAKLVLAGLLLLSAHYVFAKNGPLQIDYTVSLSDPSSQQFHIATSIKNIDQPSLNLSLPTWAPGWYTVENYFKNVLRFRITDDSGKVIPLRMTRKQTWTLDTSGIHELHVDYDYRATVLALNQAKITKDFAFFTGIELFLEPEGHRNEPSTVHFVLPTGWNLVTALHETSDPMTFTAANYDVLVDAPAEMGSFDMTRFDVEGKPHYLVTCPAGAFSRDKANEFAGMLAKVATADSKMFGGLPYDKYVYYYFFSPPESNASGALEHLNSHVSFAPPGNAATATRLVGTAAHEYFHLWNVKRIRPAGMWPYDYSRENETPLLWVSEGFTNYYGDMAIYRAGLRTKDDFYGYAATAAAEIENNDARRYISPSNASVSTWAGYDTPVAFPISYYTQGQNLAALLDLSIRNDTNGASSLDDVMLALFDDFYKKGKGFTTEDMIKVINGLTKHDYHDFYTHYVWGTDVPDYNMIFGYAGLKLAKSQSDVADLGFFARFRDGGLTVVGLQPGSAAVDSGLKTGDVITEIDGTAVSTIQINSLAGKTAVFSIKREGADMKLPVKIASRSVASYQLTEDPAATPKELKIRGGWLAR